MRPFLSYMPVFRILHFLTGIFLRLKFNYRAEKIEPEHKPYIVLSNHTTNYDPVLLGLSFPELLYYVASEHIFRLGFISKLLIWLVDPIPLLKSSTDFQTVIKVLKKLRNGYSICLFAEGNRTFSGESSGIPASTGKLVSMSGASLITYRIDGGYFTNPRWGKKYRKNHMSGRKVSEYSPERLKSMTVDELNEIIKRDLYVNAYDEQQLNMAPYCGTNIAENLEVALYICPLCGGIGTLQSRHDQFCCSCGLRLRYTPFGLFESLGSSPPPFQTVLDWFRWQSIRICEMSREFFLQSPDKPMFSDNNQSLWRIEKASSCTLHGKGTLSLYKDRLELAQEDGRQFSFPIDKITDMSIYSRMVLIFSTADDVTYEIKTRHPRSAVKYLDVFRFLESSSES